MTTALAILFVGNVGLMALSWEKRRPAFAIGASIVWLLWGLSCLSLSVGDWNNWDIYFGFWWLGLAFCLVSALEGFILAPRRSETEPEEEDDDERYDNYADREAKFDRRLGRRGLSSASRARDRRSKKESDEFSRTGRMR